jgi:hypothetical protein
LLTRTRGRDETNILAMLASMAAVLVLGRVKLPAFDPVVLATQGRWQEKQCDFGALLPAWWPNIAFPWYVFIGCVTCIALGIVFRTPRERLRRMAGQPRDARPLKEAVEPLSGEVG